MATLTNLCFCDLRKIWASWDGQVGTILSDLGGKPAPKTRGTGGNLQDAIGIQIRQSLQALFPIGGKHCIGIARLFDPKFNLANNDHSDEQTVRPLRADPLNHLARWLAYAQFNDRIPAKSGNPLRLAARGGLHDRRDFETDGLHVKRRRMCP